MTVREWHVDISVGECEALLAAARYGRLAVLIAGRPQIRRVRHVFDPARRCLLLAAEVEDLRWPWVAYEVDGDVGPDEGWRIHVVGRVEGVLDPAEVDAIGDPGTGRWVRVVQPRIVGMRVRALRTFDPERTASPCANVPGSTSGEVHP